MNSYSPTVPYMHHTDWGLVRVPHVPYSQRARCINVMHMCIDTLKVLRAQKCRHIYKCTQNVSQNTKMKTHTHTHINLGTAHRFCMQIIYRLISIFRYTYYIYWMVLT